MYLNNVVEADHGKLELLVRPVRGLKTLKTSALLTGYLHHRFSHLSRS